MHEFCRGALLFILYVLPLALLLFALRRFTKVEDELFRKLLHFLLLGAYVPFLFGFEHWWMADIFLLSLIVIFYPVLALAARIPAFSSFVNERKNGEFKSSLVQAMLTAVFSIAVCWGLLGERLLVMACVYAWGVGDGFAALAGKRWGRHTVRLSVADGHKTWEGTCAMFLTSALSVLTLLLIRGGLSFWLCLLLSLLTAAACAFVELCSKGGRDTFTCPAAAMAVLLPLVKLLGG